MSAVMLSPTASADTELRYGARGIFVEELQRYLNEKLKLKSKLPINGVFDRSLERAVLQFQKENWLREDGIVGECTWNALRGMEDYCILHDVKLIPQPDHETCWAASVAMILGEPTIVPLPKFMQDKEGKYEIDWLDEDFKREFTNHFGIRVYESHGYSWSATALADILRKGPIFFGIAWDSDAFSKYQWSKGHALVVAGIRGKGAAKNTTLRMYDPAPVGKGTVGSNIYSRIMRNVPACTAQIWQKI